MQLEFLKFLQEISSPILDTVFIFITNFGSEIFYVLAITYIYWCLDKKFGIRLLFVTMASTYINSFLKELFQTLRPMFVEGIKPLYVESAPGYSFPSGHTQITSTFWFYLMRKLKNNMLYVIGLSIVVLVGFSRLYLRLHWPIDVIGGMVIAIIIVVLFDFITKKLDKFRITYSMAIILCISISTIILLLKLDETTAKIIGVTTAALIGYFAEKRYINFIEKGNFKHQIIKYAIGVLGLLVLQIGLKQLLPANAIFNYIRYFGLGIWVTLIAPILFIKMGISNKHDNKEKIIS